MNENFIKLEKIANDYFKASNLVGLAAGIMAAFPTYETVLEIYVDEKLGFKKLREEAAEIAEENPEMTEDELKAEIKKRRKEAIEYYLNEGRQELEDIYNNLKAQVINFTKEIERIVKEILNKIKAILLPPVLGPIAPNPLSSLASFAALLLDIKARLDKIMTSLLVVMGFIKKLGLENNQFTTGFTSKVLTPINKMQKAIGSLSKKNDAAIEAEKAANVDNTRYDKYYTTVDPDGNETNGVAIREFAADRYNVYTIPFDPETRVLVDNIRNAFFEYTVGDIAWGQMIWDFDDFILKTKASGQFDENELLDGIQDRPE